MKRPGTAPFRQILFATTALGSCVYFPSTLVAGPYSSGLGNTTAGAIDPAIPGFVGSLGNGKSDSPNVVNPAFAGWATGYTSYLPAAGVDPGWNSPQAALGPVTGDNFDIVSLGDPNASQIAAHTAPGQITLSFDGGIGNRLGADFAVFENAQGASNFVFAELAYVEVSSDGAHFARFPSASLTLAAVGPYGSIDPSNAHNLAGKHVNAYGNSWGTPFDLSDLASDPLVQSKQVKLNGIRYVRLIDIPGNGSFSDSENRSIYDAWLTFGSGGFDLEAIGVTHPWLGGDANLDGRVDAVDLGILASHWQGSGYTFESGDFNSSGRVDIADLYILAINWQASAQSLDAALASLGLGTVSIPEPSTTVGLFALSSLLARRRSHAKRNLDSRRNAKMLRSLVTLLLVSISNLALAGTADFEDLLLPADSFHNNSSFTSGGTLFNNDFIDFGGGFTGWEGFAYSSKTDTTTAGFGNQYSAITGQGAGNSPTFGVGFVGSSTPPTITLPAGVSAVSMMVTNTTYAYLSMRDGDPFAKKFGGVSGNDPDFLKLTIARKDGAATIGSIDFYLADYRFADNSQDYLVNSWTTIDLSSLSGASNLLFTMSSSDNGQFGMNTPAYFAMDNLIFVPEPGICIAGALFGGLLIGRRRRLAGH